MQMLTTMDKIWTQDGLFRCEDSIPLGLNCRITVPSIATDSEIAAMIELTGRIALHVLEVPDSIYSAWFIEDILDEDMYIDGIQLIVGYRDEWLRTILGASVGPLLSKCESLPNDSGVLAIIQDGSRPRVIVTGNSEYGLICAARYLVSEGFGQGIESTDFIAISPKDQIQISNVDGAMANTPHAYSLHNIFTVDGVYNGTTDEDVLPVFNACVSVQTTGEGAAISTQLIGRLLACAGSAQFPLTVLPAHQELSMERLILRLKVDLSVNSPTVFLQETNTLLLSSNSVSTLTTLVNHITEEWIGPAREVELTNWRSKLAALTSTYPDIKSRALWDISLYNQITSGSQFRVPKHLWPIVRDRVLQLSGDVEVTSEPVLWERCWNDEGELLDMERSLVQIIDEFPEKNRITMVEVFTSVSRESFDRWHQELRCRLHAAGCTNIELVYRNVHKAGWNWFTSSVLPELKKISSLRTVHIQARKFCPEEKHLDLPHRFLQELFPIDAVLQNELGIAINDVHLHLADGDVPMFQITAQDEQGDPINQWGWDGMTESVPYLPSRPELGRVCIPAAGFRIFSSSDTAVPAITWSVPTNFYRFWTWYQQEVVEKLHVVLNSSSEYPKFLRMECEVSVDADEEPLPIHQECNSAAEALHEDIYFYALHALALHGEEVGDSGWRSPGAIIPFVHSVQGAPSAKVTVYASTGERSIEVCCRGVTQNLQSYPDAEYEKVRVVKYVWESGQPNIELAGFDEVAVLERWVNERSVIAEGATNDSSRDVSYRDLNQDIWQNRDVFEYLKHQESVLPGRVLHLDSSYLGEWIYAVELCSHYNAYATQTKNILYKPTLFINARHHANEISSTNAIVQLIHRVIANPDLLKRVNLVLIPLQNVDGAALHERLIGENPHWKHHAARFSACGYEFAWDYFKKDTPFGESRTYQRIWDAWRPDIVLDDHGIPSHEWIQPFAGWNSPPQFPVSYWIPIARMYTIWHELVNADNERLETDQSMRKTVTRALEEDALVRGVNEEFLKRYLRWGHQFAPDVFPVEVTEGAMTYIWRTEENPQSRDLLARFPKWVTADIITEVNDETVHGDALAAAAAAHTKVHDGLIEWILNVKSRVFVTYEVTSKGLIRVGLERQRPLTHSVGESRRGV